ncbi:helix-turn-helix transcriptional regulator [Nonomuraea gerenzanensis]|uniref:helix-turn-helix transcriptional regulator n=1 Tax=Nonomuraea gerenzanensis TaxID=93944 RepID=UPI001CD9AECA|nr:LuxR family transcriptional regulator [Nonomuraea gerenzanensis]UBU13116.1 AAA family ATPase [Nonomuraea gerenzanensis]
MASLASPALVGRDAPLRLLIGAVTCPPAVIQVQGEAGIGKTSLVRAAIEPLTPPAWTVLIGHCHQIREPFPYGPVFDALRHVASALPGHDRLSPVTGALRGYLPELAGHLPPAPSPPPMDDPRAERHHLFRAVHALLGAAGPVVLVVEDLHWADDGTRDLLRFLTDQPPEGLALVVTFRREELPVPGLPFGHAYRRAPGVRSEVISLTPLDVEGVRRLAGALLRSATVASGAAYGVGTPAASDGVGGPTASDGVGGPAASDGVGGPAALTTAFAAKLHDRTAGVPFVIEEVVRSLLDDEGRLPEPEALDRMGVPVLLREAMAERLTGLSPAALRVVHAAAVMGLPAEEPLINAVAGTPAPQPGLSQAPHAPGEPGAHEAPHGGPEAHEAPHGGPGLSEALQAGVLREHPDGLYGFRHALAQQAVYDAIPGPDRRLTHRRAMAALAALDPPPLVQLAHHARRAGDFAAWQRHGSAAADHAAAIGDIPLAVELLEGLLADPKLPRQARGPLALRLSRVAAIGLSHRRVVRILRHLLSDDFLSSQVRGEARLNLGVLLSNQAGAITAGRQEILAALPDLADSPSLAARGLALLAMPVWGGEPLAMHEEWMAQAEKLLVEDQDPELTAAVQANKVSLAMLVGSPDAFELAGTLPANDPSTAVRRQVARGYSNLYDAALALGHYAAAARFAERSRRVAEETGALYPAFLVEMSSIRLDLLTGRWEGLRERALAAVEMTYEAPLLAVEARLALGVLGLARGEWDEAGEHLEAAGVRDLDSGFLPVAVAGSSGLVELHLTRGALEPALAAADLAVTRLRRKGVWVWGDQLVPAAVHALLRAGRSQAAAGLVAEFAAGISGRNAPSAHAGLCLAEGSLAGDAGGFEEAARCYGRARAAYLAMPRPYAAARAAELEAGAWLAAAGHEERATHEQRTTRERSGAGEPGGAGEQRAAERERASHPELAIDRGRASPRGRAAGLIADAAERYAALGATHDAARCRRLLRELGPDRPPARRSRKAGGVLSPRESEVARLVALGRTNREIAEVLFLSQRTVDTHVARVLQKLGVRTRAEVREPRPEDRPGPVTPES